MTDSPLPTQQGGVVALAAIIFIAWKLSQRRFSAIDDEPDIRWPELQQDAASLNPAGTHQTGGAGFEMGERRASDEWDARGPFLGAGTDDGRGSPAMYSSVALAEGGGYADGRPSYDPYLGAPANAYPPQHAQNGYYNPYGQQAFSESQGYVGGGAPAYLAGGTDPYADEKEDVAPVTAQQAPSVDNRRQSTAASHYSLGRDATSPPTRSDTLDRPY